jgi:hypothetical protein
MSTYTAFSVLLNRGPKGSLIINEAPAKFLQGTTVVKEAFSVENGSHYTVEKADVGDFLRQLVVLGYSFAFGGA